MRISRDRIVFDSEDWLGGYDGLGGTATTVQRIFGSGYSYAKSIDPINVNLGVLYPGKVPTLLTNITTNRPLNITSQFAVSTSDENLFYSLSAQEFGGIQPTASGGTYLDTGGFPHTLATNTHSGHGLVSQTTSGTPTLEYQANMHNGIVLYHDEGTPKVFFSWYDGTDWDIGTYNPNGGSFDDDFMTTTPSGGTLTSTALTDGANAPHPLFVSKQDNVLYAGSKNKVHKYDGTTDTFTADVLTLPDNYVIKCFAETDTDLVIFADHANHGDSKDYPGGGAAAFFWHQSRPNFYYKQVNLLDDYVGTAGNWQGTIGCVTGFRGNVGRLKIYDDGRFKDVAFFPGSNPYYDLPVVGSWYEADGLVYFRTGGETMVWGGYRDQVATALHPIDYLGDRGGAVIRYFRNNLYISGGAGSSSNGIAFGGTNFDSSNATVATKTAAPYYQRGERGKVDEVSIQFIDSVSTGKGVTLKLMIDGTAYTVASGIQDTTRMIQKFGRLANGDALPSFDTISAVIEYTDPDGNTDTVCPGVVKVTVFYHAESLIN